MTVYIKEGRWGREAVKVPNTVCLYKGEVSTEEEGEEGERRRDGLLGLKDGGENSWYERGRGNSLCKGEWRGRWYK